MGGDEAPEKGTTTLTTLPGSRRAQNKKTMSISIREHWIPAYDELSRLRAVKKIPYDLDVMEQETAGGIVKKVKAILDSDYFKSLPDSKTIKSGMAENFQWRKSDAKKEMSRIWNECKNSL